MPSREHELTIELLRRSPSTLTALLRAAFAMEVDAELSPASEAFAQLEPSSTYVADLVLRSPKATFIVEVQNGIDQRKRFSWPFYAASSHAATGQPTWLVVLALSKRVADWADRPIPTFQGGGFRPLVIGPDRIPRVTDLDEARRAPELAILSALSHGREEGATEIGLAGWVGAATVALENEDRGKLYADAVLASLRPEDMRALLEVMMKTEGNPYVSEFARRNFEDGRVEGKAEGRVDGLRVAVEVLCRAHGIEWSARRASTVSALDLDALEQLLARISADRRWPDDA